VIAISIRDDGTVMMTGPVTKICEGVLSSELFD
jgi:diaminopimelate epimerase